MTAESKFKLNVKNIKLKDELGNFLALIKLQLDVLTRKALEGTGSYDVNISKGITELTKSFESATRSKIALDKAEKKKEESLSPEEELEAVIEYLLGFDHKERYDIVNTIILGHNKKCISARKTFLIREVGEGV